MIGDGFTLWLHEEIKGRKPLCLCEENGNSGTYEQRLPTGLVDYKFYCFDGEPKFLYVSKGLEDHATARISFLTMDWQFAPYVRNDYAPFEQLPPRPRKFDEMIDVCRSLSKGKPFLRVDLYEIGDQVFFSELTFSPCSGYMPFREVEHDTEVGSMLCLPR